jgi:hypothetical protein
MNLSEIFIRRPVMTGLIMIKALAPEVGSLPIGRCRWPRCPMWIFRPYR